MNALKPWLASIKMEKYLDVLVSNSVDLDIMPQLTEANMAEMGIPLGDRKRLLSALSRLKNENPRPANVGSSHAVSGFTEPESYSEKPIGELRQMTLMFVDLVNSTGMVEELGIENYRDTLRAFQSCNVEAIRKNFGYFSQFIGDGVVAYYGYPIANEDDAERAVLTALEIIQNVGSIKVATGRKLAVRVGIATGDVLIDDLMQGAQQADHFALGNIPNLAARLQSLADPGQVAISGRTRRLLGRNFKCTSIGRHELKGFAESVGVWLVEEAQSAELRFDKRRQAMLTPLIGREDEFGLLEGRWNAACRGEGQAVFLSGEAGLGKSRLAEEVYQQLVSPIGRRFSFQCSPYHQNSAFYPIKSHLNHAVGLTESDTPAARSDKLETFLKAGGGVSDEVAIVYANFLSVGGPEDTVVGSPEETKARTIETLLHYIEKSAEKQPILILFEDLHWIDPSTEEVLNILIDRFDKTSVMVLGTYRPEYQPRWWGKSQVTTLSLPGLGPRQTEELINSLNKNNEILNGLMRTIVSRAEGVPLFVEEMISMLARAPGTGWTDARAEHKTLLPSNLKDLLRARLDHLTTTPDTVSICAILGHSFTPALVAAVAEREIGEVDAELENLVQAQIFVRLSHLDKGSYSFRHAMIRDVAYDAILPQRVKQLHNRIAETVTQHFPNLCDRSPEILALHYRGAEKFIEARNKWQEAANIAMRDYASQEAIAHLTAALDAHERATPDENSDSVEIAIRQSLSVALEIRAWGSPDIAENLERLILLNEKIGEHSVAFSVLDQLIGENLIAGRPDIAWEYCKRMRALLVDNTSPAMQTLSEHNAAMASLLMGEFDRAIAHFDRALMFRAQSDLSEINRYYPADPETVDTAMRCWAGALRQDDRKIIQKELDHAIATAEAQKSEFSRCFALSIIATIYCTLDDPEQACIYARMARIISKKIEFQYWDAWSSVVLGWAEARCGQPGNGIATLSAGLERYIATGSAQIIAFSKTLLADAYLCEHEVEEAAAQIADAQDVLTNSTIRFHDRLTEHVAQKIATHSSTTQSETLD